MRLYEPARAADHIPVVDIGSTITGDHGGQKDAAWQVHQACRETGFFYIANHGLPQHLIDAQFEQVRRFFALPLADKLAVHMPKSPAAVGYDGLTDEALDNDGVDDRAAASDYKEGFHCGLELDDDDPWARSGWRGFGHNQWPANLPGFREQTLAYQAAVRDVADRVLRLLALSLDLPGDWFEEIFDPPSLMLRILGYPPLPANSRPGQLGAGAHTDWGALTILAQDDIGGLEVMNVDGEWIKAQPIPGTFVVNLGDLIPRWTNDLYRSTPHRVCTTQTTRWRYSIPFFYNPRPTAVIECIPTCTDHTRPVLFEPCTSGEHIAEMARRSYGIAVGRTQA